MDSENDNKATTDVNYANRSICKQMASPIEPARHNLPVTVGRKRGRKSIHGNQLGQQYRRSHDTAMCTFLMLTAVAVSICLSSARPPFVFVDSFSFKLFHRSSGRRHESSTDAASHVLSATSSSSAEKDIKNMSRSVKNSIEKAKNNNNKNDKNGSLASLVDWKFDSVGKKITGRSVNHPFVPDGELVTTACLDPSCMDGVLEDGNVVSTVKGTQYELLKPPPVGSSYFSTPTAGTREDKNQVFKEDVFSYTTTGIPYDQQLAFLEELTDMVKIMQAAEAGTSTEVSEFSSPTSTTNPLGSSASGPVVAASTSAPLSTGSTLEQRNAQVSNKEPSSTFDQVKPENQLQQVEPIKLDKQQRGESFEELPQRPTFSINKSQQSQVRNQIKESSSSNSNKIDDNADSVLDGVATLAAATTAVAAVTLGGQTGLGTEFLDETKRQAEARMPPPANELLASINTQVQEQSKVVLPYLEEQIRIAEAKVEEAHLEEKAKSALKIAEAKVEEAHLEEKAKNAWNVVAEYLNEQPRSTAARKGLITPTTSLEATKSVDSIAGEEVTSTSNVIAASTTPALNNEVLENTQDKVVDTLGAEKTIGSTKAVAEEELSAQMSGGVEAGNSVATEFSKETTSVAKISEEGVPAAPTDGATTRATIETSSSTAAAAGISSDSPQSLVGEQTSQEYEQVKATEKVIAEIPQAQSTEEEIGAAQGSTIEKTGTGAETDVIRSQVMDEVEVDAEVPQVQDQEKIASVAEADAIRVQAVEEAEIETDAVQIQVSEKVDAKAIELEALESAQAEAEALREAAEKAEAKAEALRTQAAEKAEAEAEVLRVKALTEEQELAEAARIIAEQMELARREVEQAATESVETQPVAEVPPAINTNIPKVEVVKGSEPLTKSAPSVVENFGGNFVVAQEELKLGSAEIPPRAPGDTTQGISENSVEKPTSEMVKDAITVEVEPVAATSLTGKGSNNLEGSEGKPSTTEMPETSSSSVSASLGIQAPELVEDSPNIIAKATELFEKGKKTTQSIADAGQEVVDAGKHSVQSVKTKGQELVDTGKRTYQTAVDTGREVIDTGKRTAEAIEEAAQKVGAKGKEVYETGQKYAGIVNEKIPIILESGEKVAATVNEKVPEIVEAGKEILGDEQKVKTIVAGSTVAGIAVALATTSLGKFGDDSQIDSAEAKNQFSSFSMNSGNETLGSVPTSENAESRMPTNWQNTQQTSRPSISLPFRAQDTSTAKSGTTSDPKFPSDSVVNPSKSTTQEAIEPEMLSSVPSAKKAVSSSSFGVKTNKVIDTTSTIKPDRNEEKDTKNSFPKSFSSQVPKKTNGFGMASVPKSESSFGRAKTRNGSSPKTFTSSSTNGTSSPTKSDVGKQSASPFGSIPKQAAPRKQGGFGVPSSKSSDSGKQVASPFGLISKADPSKKVAFGVPSSKSSDSSKRVASPFGSIPKADPSKKVAFGVPPPKSSSFGKQGASPFASSLKQAPFDKKGYGVQSSKQTVSMKEVESNSSKSFKSKAEDSSTVDTLQDDKKNSAENENSFVSQGNSKFSNPPKAISNAGAGKSASPFGESKAKFLTPPTGNTPSPFGESKAKFLTPPTGNTPSPFGENKAKFSTSSTEKKPSPFGENKAKSPTSQKTIPYVGAGSKSKFPIPPKSIPNAETGKSASPFANNKIPPKVPLTSKLNTGTDTTSTKVPSNSASDKSSKGKDRSYFTDISRNGESKPKFPTSPKTIPSTGAGKSASPFGESKTKFPTSSKTISSAGAGNSASPFGESKAKFPTSPKIIPSAEGGKSASPFGESKAKFPTSPKTIPSTGAGKGKSPTPFGEGKSNFPTLPKTISNAGTGKSASPFGESKAKFSTSKTNFSAGTEKSASPFANNKIPQKVPSTTDMTSTKVPSNSASDKSLKGKDRSYFTDTSRNGYEDRKSSSSGSSALGDTSNFDDLDSKRFPREQNCTKETPPPSDMRASQAESTYLTDENEKRFFPQSVSAQDSDLAYREGTLTEQRSSTYLTEENQAAVSPKNASSPPKSDDSKPRITSIDESALNGNDGMYGKSPDELMAEVMRIAREQEERKAG